MRSIAAHGDAPERVSAIGGGITNVIYRCNFAAEHPTLLVRVFGPGSEALIDRQRELQV